MAKKSSVEKNDNRRQLCKEFASRRAALKQIVSNRSLPVDERFAATLKLAALPRNSATIRIRNRCGVSGRARGYYRKLGLSRIALRDLASMGLIPGMTKSSW